MGLASLDYRSNFAFCKMHLTQWLKIQCNYKNVENQTNSQMISMSSFYTVALDLMVCQMQVYVLNICFTTDSFVSHVTDDKYYSLEKDLLLNT